MIVWLRFVVWVLMFWFVRLVRIVCFLVFVLVCRYCWSVVRRMMGLIVLVCFLVRCVFLVRICMKLVSI